MSVPVICTGGFQTASVIRDAITRGDCDGVSMARPLVANNDQFLRDLQLFCIVARRSSFIAAATETGISPAHVSKRIAMLEASLGVKLFMRTTRRVSITSDGSRLLSRSRTRKDAFLASLLENLDPAELALVERAVPILERLTETPS